MKEEFRFNLCEEKKMKQPNNNYILYKCITSNQYIKTIKHNDIFH